MNFLESCRKAIAIDSTPSRSSLEMASFFLEFGQQEGLAGEIQKESIGGQQQGNVILRPKAGLPDRHELMLQTHIDTVEPGNLGFWTKTEHNPFNASIYSDRIYGLGTAAAKLDLLCKIKAAGAADKKSLKIPFVVVGTFGEESGMDGATRLIRRNKVNSKWALVGEPTDLSLGHAGPGIAVIEVILPFSDSERQYHKDHDLMESSTTQSKIFRGKAAHASDPDRGENAIAKMLNFLEDLPENLLVMEIDGGVTYNTVPESCFLEFDVVGSIEGTVVRRLKAIYRRVKELEEEFEKYPIEGFTPGHPTLNIGRVRTFDDCVQVIGSCRLLPSASEEDYGRWLETLREVCESNEAKFRIRDLKPPYSNDNQSEFAKVCGDVSRKMGLNQGFAKVPWCTEASVFSRLGIECFVFGPGQGVGNAHQPNESVSLDDLEKAQMFYQQIIESFCQ